MNITIESHYDPSGVINSKSNPIEEFEIWKKHAEKNKSDWRGDEFTLADFENYIENLGGVQ